ncbi:hypothetical protein EDD80_11037 [Anseongella ginsenosidimutans]|uniref:Uncharacterized protein n=1 Tax=Anseongella ginsenosidimutans TaxID=496056 RepID=A0A4R3KN37_9SPHI|nr:hypothetical protein [Anseongella ginsenosidimutans]QEC52417.1 hypothetical protein FRZ59_08765 [Anseongella ginsenosidimutans]TCS85839.1 hypothetical protein EDD80_11037 [Anseongella ginsenosidimutans]
MKATIEFNLPEDDHEAQLAMNAGKISSVITDVLQKISHSLKHEDLDEQYAAGLEKSQQLILDSLEE